MRGANEKAAQPGSEGGARFIDAKNPTTATSTEQAQGADRRRITSPKNGRRGGRDAVTKYIADEFIATQGDPFPMKKHRGQWYRYDGAKWTACMDDDLKSRVVGFLRNHYPNHATRNMVSNVVENLVAFDVGGIDSTLSMPCWLPNGGSAKGWIAMTNGIVNVEALARSLGGDRIADNEIVRPLTPNLFSTFSLPYAYEPQAKCPMWTAYLDGVQPDPEAREILQMLAGLALVPDCSYEVFFILYGEAGCGKTVFLYVLEKVVGPSNVCVLPLSKFAEKHSTHLLTEHLLNMVGDLPTSEGRGEGLHGIEGILKDVSSGGLLSCERKNQQPYKAPAISRCIFATNSLPTFADRTNGIWDRFHVVPFEVRFRDTDRQNPLLKEQVAAAELPGVFLWAVEGLAKLRRLKQFPRSARGREIAAKHRADCDREAQFLRDRYTERKGGFISTTIAYSSYRTFCSESGYHPKNVANFANDVRRVFPGVLDERRMVAGTRERGFLNLDHIFTDEL